MDTVRLIMVAILGYCILHTVAANCVWVCFRDANGKYCELRCTEQILVKRSAGARNDVPCAFTNYDLDLDGFVTLLELDSILNSTMKDHTIKATFYMMDHNDDGVVDNDEFRMGPLAKRDCV